MIVCMFVGLVFVFFDFGLLYFIIEEHGFFSE